MSIDEATNKSDEREGRRRRRSRSRSTGPAPNAPATENQGGPVKDRPTPSRRDTGKRNGNIITRFTRPVTQYVRDTRSELQKVTWPTRDEGMRLSGIVLAVTIAFAIGLGLLDFLYGELFRLGFETPTIFIVAAVIAVIAVGGATVYLRRRPAG